MAGVFQSRTAHSRRGQPSSMAMAATAAKRALPMPLPRKAGRTKRFVQVDARVAAPCGIVVKVEREADSLAVPLGYEAVEARGGAKAVAQQVGGRGDGRGGFALVLGQLADEGEDFGDVGEDSRADINHRK